MDTADGVCIQFWKIEISDLDCPISFDGSFDIEWTAVCNPANVDNTQCNSYLSTYSSHIAVTTPDIAYTDAFACNVVNVTHVDYGASMNYYTNALFAVVDNDLVYRAGTDTVYVEIAVADLSSVLSANLLNVWLCAASAADDGTALQIDTGNEMGSGCFDLDLVDADTFNTIILNEVPLLYNAQIYDASGIANNIVRFSFTAPSYAGKDVVYIHAELELVFDDGANRRMLVSSVTDDSVYDFVHFADGFSVEHDGEARQSISAFWILVIILGALSCVIVALLSKMYLMNRGKQSRGVGLYDQVLQHANAAANSEHDAVFGDGHEQKETPEGEIMLEEMTRNKEFENDQDDDILIACTAQEIEDAFA